MDETMYYNACATCIGSSNMLRLKMDGSNQHLLSSSPEWTTVEGGGDGHDGVDGRQGGEEEDDQQHGHVEVVGAGGLEDALLRDVAAHDSPALQVHGDVEAQHVQSRQTGGRGSARMKMLP